jgi:tRNA(fMet)-specific endonuclease VapC
LTKLLDTSTCIAVTQGRSQRILDRFENELVRGETFVLSALVLHELWFGVEGSPRPAFHTARLNELLGRDLEVHAFDDDAARAAARIRAELRREGTMIGTIDILIAGHAMSQDWTLVTGDLKDFRRVPGLRVENWAEPQSE